MSANQNPKNWDTIVEESRKREKRASQRMLFYILIPIAVGLLWMAFSLKQVKKAEQRVEKLTAVEAEKQANVNQLQDSLTRLMTVIDASKKELMELEGQMQGLINSTKTDPYADLPEPLADDIKSGKISIKAPRVALKKEHWVIIVGSDATLEGARYEKSKLAKQTTLGDKAKILKRSHGTFPYVTVVWAFDMEKDAKSALVEIKNKVSESAYLAQANYWGCPEPVEQPEGYWECK